MRPSHYIYPGLKVHLLTNKQLEAIKGKNGDAKSLSLIFLEVCNHFDLPPDKARGKSRDRDRVWARQLYCYFARKFTKLSLKAIGNVIGRDHTTVIHCISTASNVIEKHPDLEKDAEALESKVSDKLFIEYKTIKDFVK